MPGQQVANNIMPNIQPAVSPTGSIAGSPWEETPPEISPAKKPAIIGSLDPKEKSVEEEASTPFNVPENIEEQVGKTLPAQKYVTPKPEEPAPSPYPMLTPANPPAPVKPEGSSFPPIQPPTQPPASRNDNLFDFNTQAEQNSTSPVVAPASPVQNSSSKNDSFLDSGSNMNKKAEVPQQNSPTPQKSFFGRIFRKNSGGGAPTSPAQNPVAQTFQPSGERSLGSRRLIIILGMMVFFALIIGLTELGLLSVGAEKIYGVVGVERLWGGLSKDPSSSLALMASKMQQNPNFKIKGTITLTVDKSINSPITSPLAAIVQNKYLAKDQNVGAHINAVKTATDTGNGSDIYDMYTDTDTDTGTDTSSDSTASDTSSSESLSEDYSSSSDTSISTDSSELDSATDSDSSFSNDSTSLEDSSSSSEVSNVLDIKASVKASSNKDSIEADLSLDDSQASAVNLLFKEGTLLVKSDNLKFGSNAASDKWLSYEIDKTKGKNVQSEMFNISSKSGMSVKGKRTASEKVGSTRCYKYQIDSLELGNALSGIGITSDMVQSVSGNIWIGINDKLLRKASLKIVSPVSSSVSSINLDLEFSGYDVDNKITYPDDSEITAGTISDTSSISSDTATGTTGTSTSNDSQRKTDVNKILAALKLYKAANSTYPVSANLLKLNSDNNIIKNALVPAYLPAWPADPTEGWYYAYKSDGVKCSISARLEDTTDLEGQMIGGVFLYLKYNND